MKTVEKDAHGGLGELDDQHPAFRLVAEAFHPEPVAADRHSGLSCWGATGGTLKWVR